MSLRAISFVVYLGALAVVRGQWNNPNMYCNYGTDQVPQLNDCGNCTYPDWITEDPGLSAGFPVHRQCTTVTGSCTVTDSSGNVLKNKGGGDAHGSFGKSAVVALSDGNSVKSHTEDKVKPIYPHAY
ncbi:hypothetical protein COL26b_006116 [Colletotrichum chrysophilum]|uniref:uncharacterized protein n=1 Tax=Colletotrichum chrysophilum TaxID=1836956 RepID=UPI0023002687|nr:uncharacterized protein COL26b_006116 [Colletotrichum chrysophilum]KAJ0375610.1 hypothetical protein COL26b_006116 [Colletotrichum chrysophilum]